MTYAHRVWLEDRLTAPDARKMAGGANPTRMLLVEPDDDFARRCSVRIRGVVEVHRHAEFRTARQMLLAVPFAYLVANVRLQAYNGLHLVHLVTRIGLAARSIVYTDQAEPSIAHEIQRSGAFYETAARLPAALPGYLSGRLPAADRRDPVHGDRRVVYRGGRRTCDAGSSGN
jgi:hypothetical protein